MPAEIPQDFFSFMYLSLSTLISSLCTKIDRGARYFRDSRETASSRLLAA